MLSKKTPRTKPSPARSRRKSPVRKASGRSAPRRGRGKKAAKARRLVLARQLADAEAFRVFHDFGLLREISLWLEILAERHGIELPAGDGSKGWQARARAVDEILAKTRPWPRPFVELTERLLENRVLDRCIRGKLALRGIRGLRHDELLLDVKVKLLFITIRNAHRWFEQHWYGRLRQHIASVTGRTEKASRLREMLLDDYAPELN